MGLNDRWEVDSAAIIGYHTGKNPDPRAISVLKEKGITNYSHSARKITPGDFDKYDWIFGMDHENIATLNDLKPPNSKAVVDYLGKYDPLNELIIRDPYYDNHNDGFEAVFNQCTRCITAFLEKHEGI
ncbi:PREDICTED: low molecular weight phosphotyrosine protein phosphatase-like isoform X2 [Polistes dominula]|uniref:Low molecular weight phosphotyrosine protein phosphatase n=1 Tax=Polistes dominula TaxID=743375 RepID=A0ABM1IQ19_POLDO|nr:PREDICTED: low molecular weight phosphotyrosine protein phosphatase-like isoform X2 [Polistes dominula]